MAKTMKEVRVWVGEAPEYPITTTLHEAAVPTPGPDQVVIRVVVAGTNPKDWKYPVFFGGKSGENTGDDVAGYIEAVGANVSEFNKGDRVAAFHEMGAPHGAFAEYAVAYANTTFPIPENTSFEEAATIPLAAMTAATALFCRIGVPEPWVLNGAGREKAKQSAVLIYGGATAVGSFAIKLLQRANVHPIIAVAGRGGEFVEGLLDKSKGDVVVDYRKGEDALIKGIKAAIPKGKSLYFALDAVSENKTGDTIAKVLDSDGHLTAVLPYTLSNPQNINFTITNVGDVHGLTANYEDFGYAWYRLFNMGLKEGWLKAHPYEVLPGGLKGVEGGLQALQAGKASAVKYVYRIAETERL
ncbi:NADPH2:quinone reductase [Dactylonectria macrodidyma]|uniref:NADPH2:quinone reductase n=1 Tax=Dactylonectria macrodidyma TaxID=307937 RepID=A0A9P9F9L6_9HYPO|nr:NADPH2:quinone reductase [Dactylonectria macrodidyma]